MPDTCTCDCHIESLIRDSAVFAVNRMGEAAQNAIELNLLYRISGTTESIRDLLIQSGQFANQGIGVRAMDILESQLLCNIAYF